MKTGSKNTRRKNERIKRVKIKKDKTLKKKKNMVKSDIITSSMIEHSQILKSRAVEHSQAKPEVVAPKTNNPSTSSINENIATNYWSKHWNIFKRSLRFDSTLLKLIFTDIGFIITLFLSYVLIYFFWIKNMLSVSYLMNILDTAQTSAVSSSEVMNAWNHFITTVIFIVLLIILLYIILLSIYSALSHIFITKNKLGAKLFLNFIYIYAILTLIYFLLVLSIFYLSNNILLIAWGVLILTIIYLYSLLIFYLVTNDGNISKIFSHGFKSIIKFHNRLPPILLTSIMFAILLPILNIIFGWNYLIFFLAITILLLYLLNWMKKYLHHIIHS